MLRRKRRLCTTIEEEEEEEEDHPKTIRRRMSAATEASLDDIVHSYGGIRAIKMTGDNTPSHVIDVYKELLNVRRSRGEFDESLNLSECDLATMKSINRDVFRFLQSIVNDWNHDLDDRHHAAQFGAHQTTRIDGSMVNSVVIPTAVKPNQFQRHYGKLLRNVKKHVDKNVKIKKSMSCNCTTTTYRINDSFFLVSICQGNSTTTKMFIIMWFIDCCMTMNNEPTILCCATPNDDYQKWSLYEGCHGNDSICSDMDDCEKMLTDAWPIHCGPCIINVPEEFSNLELSKKCDVSLILNDDKETHNNEQYYDGFHTLKDNDNDLVLCNMSLFCSSGFDKECNTKGCPKVNKCRQRKFKKCQQGEQNLIYLTNWLFVHPPNATTNSIKMLIIKPPPPPLFDDEQQRQQCTCLNAISYTKQIRTSYSFSKPPM